MTARRAPRPALTALAAAAAALLPAPAEAHLVTTGLGPLYDGVSHVFLSPEDLVPVLALALLAGLGGPVAGRWTLFALPAAWLAGGLAGYYARQPLLPGAVTSLSFLIAGGLTAAGRHLQPAPLAALAAGIGLVHGWLNGVGLAEAEREALGLAGIAGAIFVLVALLAACAVPLRAGWARVAVRVAGSWVAAIGLLLLGWSLRGGSP